MVVGVMLAAAVAAQASAVQSRTSLESMLEEESPDVFLAKATLQQYLSRIVRQDWEGVRRLTHPKALAVIERAKRRGTRADLAPWSDTSTQLKTFRFTGEREVSPGVVLVQVGEDLYRADQQEMSVDDPCVYLLIKSGGGFLVADKKPGAGLTQVSDRSVRTGYSGYLDHQVQAQARRESALFDGRHR